MDKNKLLSDLAANCDRRTFLKACGALGLGATGAAALPGVFDALRMNRRWLKVTQTRLQMGTFVAMTAVHESRNQSEEAIGRAFEEINRLIAIFSRHDSTTPVSVLNQDGVLAGPPPELVDMMLRARDFGLRTAGAFDVTVKPLLDLIADTVEKDGRVPTAAAIDEALASVGCQGVDVDHRHIHFKRSGMGITLDGIAKGHIVDRASDVLVRHGIENHLINAGGDIRVRGVSSDGDPWRIAIQDPEKNANYPAVITLTDGAVATSGDYEVFFDEEKVFHHIVNPRSGASPTRSSSVSVVAKSVMEADALSTAVFVLEPVEGTRLVNATPGAECLVLTRDGAQLRSRGWSAHVPAERNKQS